MRTRRPVDPERGSITPLILGFFLICLLLVAGSIALGDTFSKQRYLQSVCDGAAIAAANSVDVASVHGGGVAGADLPLSDAQRAVTTYLSYEENRGVTASARVRDTAAVDVTCRWRTHIAFGAVVGRGGGLTQTAYSTARSPITA